MAGLDSRSPFELDGRATDFPREWRAWAFQTQREITATVLATDGNRR